MAKKAHIGVDNVAHKIKKNYIGVDNVARKIKKIYIGVNGVAKLCWSAAGLYDSDDNLIADWDTLVNTYGLNVEKDYGTLTTDVNYCKTTSGSGYYVLNNYSDLAKGKKLIIPDSVTSIGDAAFFGCTSLTTLTIPDSVTNIGYRAFYSCNLDDVYYTGNLEGWCQIDFHSYESNPMRFGANLYFNGELVANVIIPDFVTSIGSAFSGCGSLASVTIPDSVKSIGDGEFESCTSLTSITIPDSVTSIGNVAFGACPLTSVTIPNSVTSIGERVFYNCYKLTNIIIANPAIHINDKAFEDCTSGVIIRVPWAEGEVAGAPWGATNATIYYNSLI